MKKSLKILAVIIAIAVVAIAYVLSGYESSSQTGNVASGASSVPDISNAQDAAVNSLNQDLNSAVQNISTSDIESSLANT